MATYKLIANQILGPIPITRNSLVRVTPASGASATVEYSKSQSSAVYAGTATWSNWPSGSVSSVTEDIVNRECFMRVTAVSGSVDIGIEESATIPDSLDDDWRSMAVSSTTPPPTNYVQYAPKYSRVMGRVLLFTGFNGAADNVLRNQALGGMTWLPDYKIPSTANAVVLLLDCKIASEGAAGTHEFNASSYMDHAGSAQHTNLAFACYEPSGMSAGVWIGGGQMEIVAPITGANLEITTRFVDSAGSGFGSIVQGAYVVGYYD